jgi:hypothetical protein
VSGMLMPPVRSNDPPGQRFGARISALILIGACMLGIPWLAPLVGLNIPVTSAFGTHVFLPARAWPRVRRALRFVAGATARGWHFVATALQIHLTTTGMCAAWTRREARIVGAASAPGGQQ